ncbi:hypothetical protein TNCV_2650631 [Trichonephila clavipes]|nr:hypothetical protein TNCV_2650631 [Trichonephila clavipes]
MSYHNHLDDYLGWEVIGRLEAGSMATRSTKSSLPAVEIILNKWYCYQEGRQRPTQSSAVCTGSLLGINSTTILADNGSS